MTPCSQCGPRVAPTPHSDPAPPSCAPPPHPTLAPVRSNSYIGVQETTQICTARNGEATGLKVLARGAKQKQKCPLISAFILFPCSLVFFAFVRAFA